MDRVSVNLLEVIEVAEMVFGMVGRMVVLKVMRLDILTEFGRVVLLVLKVKKRAVKKVFPKVRTSDEKRAASKVCSMVN